jgi:hypothetical protein
MESYNNFFADLYKYNWSDSVTGCNKWRGCLETIYGLLHSK